MNKGSRRFISLVAGALAIVAGMQMNLANATPVTCGSPSVTFDLGPAIQAACFSGNDTNTIDASFVLFGSSGWVLADKSDDGTSGDQSILFTDAPFSGETAVADWAIDSLPAGFDVVLTLKQANSFAAFLVTAASGTWSTSGPGSSVNGLSHASIYYHDGGNTKVPTPGSMVLLVLGLAGMAVHGWRRRAAVAP